MVRIFLPLSFLSSISLIIAMTLGLMIDDPKAHTIAAQTSVQYHFLAALTALVFATMVHAIVFTYFMGTGRWIEETSNVYRLDSAFHARSSKVKYRVFALIVVCFLMLLATGAFGAAADPASPMQSKGIGGFSAAQIHLMIAITTIGLNLLASWVEFRGLEINGEIIDQVLAEVKRIRLEKGLPVEV